MGTAMAQHSSAVTPGHGLIATYMVAIQSVSKVSKVLPTLVQTFSLGTDEITWTGSSQEDYRQPDASGRLGRRELPSNAIKNTPFVQMC